jgi:YfiH family protein
LVWVVGEEAAGDATGDGLVTERSGVLVGIWTADCVPLHLVAPRARVAAALHCGWRGSAAGILPTAFDLLERRWGVRPNEVEAALGPAIGGCCYEVGEEIRGAFVARAGARLGEGGFAERGHRLFLDLRTFLEGELRGFGVVRVERVGPCTACRPDLLHSYRKQGRAAGRQLNWIGWLA